MSWLLFTLLGINLWTFANIIDKNVVSKRVKSPLTALIIGNIPALFYGLAALSIAKVFSVEGFFLGLGWTFILLLYFKALSMDEASKIIALYSITPIFVSILAFIFLGEAFGPEKYIGIILIVLGAMLISMKKFGKFKFSKALPLMAFTAVVYAIMLIWMKATIDNQGFVPVFTGMEFGIFLGSLPLLLIAKYRKEVTTAKKKTFGILFISSMFGVSGLLSMILALSLGPASLISAIEQTQSLFVLFYVVILTHLKPHIISEDITRGPLMIKVVAIVMMVVGAIAISV